MAISITVQAQRGAGKTFLIEKMIAALKADGFGGRYIDGEGHQIECWKGREPQRVVIFEVQGPGGI